MNNVVRIGTRKSALAIAQTKLLTERCRAVDPDLQYEIVEMSTAGDRILDRPLYEFAGKGMFVSAFEQALLEGEIDAAVHSGKDMPVETAAGLAIPAVLPRANPRDVLVMPLGTELTERSVIGTGSLRRQYLARLHLGCQTKNIRGNVNTRLRKCREGEADGLILAAAGLERLALIPDSGAWRAGQRPLREGVLVEGGFCFQELHEEDFRPAAAQGIIAVQCRADSPYLPLLEKVNDRETMACFLAERRFLEGTGAGCQQPVAAYSWCVKGTIRMQAAWWQEERMRTSFGAARIGQGEEMAARLAAELTGRMTETVVQGKEYSDGLS